jgi:hypothetical protein
MTYALDNFLTNNRSNNSEYTLFLEYIDFWLNSIHHHCGYSEKNGPPIVLIGTFADKLTEVCFHFIIKLETFHSYNFVNIVCQKALNVL